jgi:transcriptional regulator with XRE-family HTH domain
MIEFTKVVRVDNGGSLTMEKRFSVGPKLRSLRHERALSQRDLADLASLSPNAISLIERDEISPSVATLQRLANALGVRMNYFFDEGPEPVGVIYARAGTRPRLEGGGVTIEGIGARLREPHVEPFYLALAPGAGAGSGQVAHAGQEFVYCLRGQVQYEIDGATYRLEPGDFLLFEAELPHFWRNSGPETAELLLVLQAPGSPDDPARRHFAQYPSLAHIG